MSLETTAYSPSINHEHQSRELFLLVAYFLAVPINTVSPVGQHVPGEPGGQLHDAHPEVGVVDVEVVRHAPHQDQVDALLLKLPGDGARGAGEAGDEDNDNIHAGDDVEEGRRTRGEDRGMTNDRRGDEGRTHNVRGG